ncbi:50S ribosomal protein L13 [Anaerosalibacter bizertensis]|uniref:Large ribosomal subunit protein uL13 n=1 Tax=Anaerosalibacter bizertensis TaxID=932217 RepID=A0A844FED0_9FIRM|nr:50S ribosomal protein L13 [Anaerosalibacter bizertensis]MBV1816829.1 50S ribosomal protein L13 [Bacteroidales bacterium MSK.15.36]HHV26629.1 50S ribosomal protein L13 [Tissierellia bacterium]MBU5293758.1 50S ribosomal protein L13 [Anaerosalibacter bizertensis]MCB5559682.1 50S ribosomal protein L13 [Anaerosalibacter bizertensis]MCG4564459.1 50S ribosomal protein L13 [Anaerosalibacter bizertensis]
MKSYMAKPNEVERKWYVIDAEGKVLGRLATEVSKILSGKNKPIYTPHVDTGDYVIVINADKIVLTGKKLQQKSYKYHTGHPGGLREISYDRMLREKPEKVIELAVKGMLPKNSLGRQMFRKLKVYSGPEHNHEAQKPEVYEF